MKKHSGAPIVLLEDDPNDAFFVTHAVEKACIVNPIVRFQTATRARSHFGQSGTPELPVVFVMDVHLAGGETGIEFLRWLREQPSPLGSTPTMMLTGSANPEDQREAESLGAIYFLRKPVTQENLTNAVQSLGFVVSSLTGFGSMRRIEPKA